MYRLLILYFGAHGKRHVIRERLKLAALLTMGIGC
jgi:hypothetical protein